VERIPATAPPRDPTTAVAGAPSGARRNDGFFFRVVVGANLRGDSFDQSDPSGSGTGNTVAMDFELALGAHLGAGWILGGSLLTLLGSTTIELEGTATGSRRIGAVGGLALFGAWYPGSEGGWNLYLAIGGSRGLLTDPDDGSVEHTLVGASAALGGGYEWWLADEWAAGAYARLMGFGLQGSGIDASAGGLSLGGTRTFN